MKQNPAGIITFWRSILIISLLFGVLLLLLNALRNNLSFRSFAKASGPTNVLITDISKDEAGIVYHTDTPEPTLVKYEVDSKDLIATDILGTKPLKNHYARLVNLVAGSTVPVDISGQKVSLIVPGPGNYKPLQAKVITGSLPSQVVKDWTDTVVVLQTNDKYFATRADPLGNWLVSWVNHVRPDNTTEITAPIYDVNIIVYPADASVYQFPFVWNDIKVVNAGIIAPKVPPLAKPTFWEQVKKFLLTFLPNFSLLTSNS